MSSRDGGGRRDPNHCNRAAGVRPRDPASAGAVYREPICSPRGRSGT